MIKKSGDSDVKKELQDLIVSNAKIVEKLESTHKWVQSIDAKMDQIIPKVERHEETISWLRWGVMGGIAGLLGVVVNALQGLFHKGP